MDAIVLALCSAVLLGAMPVAVRFAFAYPVPAAAGTLIMQSATLAVLVAAMLVQGGATYDGLLPFLLAGAIAPGASQILITLGIRDAGSSRASVAFGTAPLFAVAFAVGVFGEEPGLGVLVGALLIVAGGMALAGDRNRPAHVRRIGIVYALCGAVLFAFRDNLLRHLALETEVPSMTGGTAMLAAGMALTAAVVLARGDRLRWPAQTTTRWLVPGALVGLAYVALLEAVYRGEVSVVAPIVGTEALWGVAFSVLLLRETERVGSRLVAGAVLVVVGAGLIGAFR